MATIDFVPPSFKNLGKRLKDLFSKKYDYKNQLSVKNNIAPELNIESIAVADSVGAVSGQVKSTYSNKDYGTVDFDVNTSGKASAEAKATKLQDGLVVSLKGTETPSGKVGVEYRRESVAAAFSVDHSSASTDLEGSLVAGVDGFSVGGVASIDAQHTESIKDYNFGAEYTPADKVYTLSVKTAEQGKVINGSYLHNLVGKGKLKTMIGGQLSWNMDKSTRVFSVATEHDVDETTAVKGKMNTEGEIASVIEHRLANPLLKVSLSSRWTSKNKNFQPEKFGVALAFGDY